MRLLGTALLALLSLVAVGCTTEQSTTQFQERAESETFEVDGDNPAAESPAAENPPAPTEVPAAAPAEEPTEVGAEVAPVATVGDGLFPTVIGAVASTSDGTSWNISVTLSSEYDTRDRYADAWRVLDAGDNELGIRVLGHDHANEQPFTRSTSVDIPEDIEVVYIEGRDQVNGWNGERFELVLSR